jgi:hypothetical protein
MLRHNLKLPQRLRLVTLADSFTFTRIIKADFIKSGVDSYFVEVEKIEADFVKFRVFRLSKIDQLSMDASPWVEKPLKDFVAIARFNGVQNIG